MSRIARTLIISAMCSPVVLAAAAGLYLWPHYHQRIIVSRGTTFITRPLHEDGTPNYLAAFNDIAGHGVKPDDNAAIPLLFVLRPTEPVLMPYWRSEVKALGITKPRGTAPAMGSLTAFFRGRMHGPAPRLMPMDANGMPTGMAYNPGASAALLHNRASRAAEDLRNMRGPGMPTGLPQLFDKYGEADRALEQERALTTRQAWQGKDAPVFDAFLRGNGPAIRATRRASEKTGFFVPLIGQTQNSAHMAFAYMPWLAQANSLSDTLLAKANLDLGKNNVAGCEANLIAIHRLGRLLAQEPVLIVYLVGLSIDHTADKGDRILLTAPGLNEQDAAGYLRRLSRLSAMPKITAAINIGERMTQLDICVSFYRDIFGNPENNPDSADINGRFLDKFINWNPTLVRINKGFDLLGQYAAVHVYCQRAEQLRTAMRTMAARIRLLRIGPFGHTPNHILSQLLRSDFHDIVGSCRLAASEKARTRLTRIGFALAAYHLERGGYPRSLAELCPKYLQTIPRNPLTGKPPVYARTTSGYTLSSPDPFTHKGTSWQFRRGLIIQIPAPVKPGHKKISLP